MSDPTRLKTLLLMRHAKSDWSHPGLADHDRPLNRRGLRAARSMANYLRERGLTVDLILASTAVRVQQTLEAMRETWPPPDAEIRSDRSLYLSSPDSILKMVSSEADCRSSIMVIGHNPGMGELACRLARKPLDFPTACLAIFSVESLSWADATGSRHWSLEDFRKPRELEEQDFPKK